MDGVVISGAQRFNVVMVALSTIASISTPCLGPVGSFQMLAYDDNGDDNNTTGSDGVGDTGTQRDDQRKKKKGDTSGGHKISKKSSEILKYIKLEHPITNIIKRVTNTLEYHCFDGSTSLSILINSLYRECLRILDNSNNSQQHSIIVHPITIVYSLQRLYTKIIMNTIQSLKISLLKDQSIQLSTWRTEDILKLVIDIDIKRIERVVYSTLYTNIRNQQQTIEITQLVVQCISSIYKNGVTTIEYIKQNRLSTIQQDRVLLIPTITQQQYLTTQQSQQSELLFNQFILENNLNNINNNNRRIIILNEMLTLDSNILIGEATKLKISNTTDRTEYHNKQLELLHRKLDILIKTLQVGVLISSADIDDYSVNYIRSYQQEIILIKNVSKQTISAISKSLNIYIVNSINQQLITPIHLQKQQQQEIEKLFINNNSISKIIIERSFIYFHQLNDNNNNNGIISVVIRASNMYTLQQKVGAFITGMGIVKQCYEDLFVLPGACTLELEILRVLNQFINNNNQEIDNEEIETDKLVAKHILLNAIQVLPQTILQNSSIRSIDTIMTKSLSNQHRFGLNLQYIVDSEDDRLFNHYNNNNNIGKEEEVKEEIKNNKPNIFLDCTNTNDNIILDGYRTKIQLYKSAIDTVCLLLKIDQIIYPSTKQQQPTQQANLKSNHGSLQRQQHIEFQPKPIESEVSILQHQSNTRKLNQLFYSDKQVERRNKIEETLG